MERIEIVARAMARHHLGKQTRLDRSRMSMQCPLLRKIGSASLRPVTCETNLQPRAGAVLHEGPFRLAKAPLSGS
jgi:hypothetical protein